MTIDDISAFVQAHKLIQGRKCPELAISTTGIGCVCFNALQDARRVYSEAIHGFVPFYAKCRYGLSRTFFLADGAEIHFIDLKTRKAHTALPPVECYYIHIAEAKGDKEIPSTPLPEEILEKVYRGEPV